MSDHTAPVTDVPVDARARRWTMRVIALLLVVQAMLLLGIATVVISRVNWAQEMSDVMLSVPVLDIILLVTLLGPLAIFELMTALGMWLGRGGAWLHAMIIQGLLLIFSLSSYVGHRREDFIYLVMLSCIIIVLYLNTNDVRLTFQLGVIERRERSD